MIVLITCGSPARHETWAAGQRGYALTVAGGGITEDVVELVLEQAEPFAASTEAGADR